jgi:HEAT repeat protein
VAEYAVKGISDINSYECGPILIKALRSDYDTVRYYAVIGLSRINYKDAIDILEFKAEYDTNDRVRMESKKAVELLQDEKEDSSSVNNTD